MEESRACQHIRSYLGTQRGSGEHFESVLGGARGFRRSTGKAPAGKSQRERGRRGAAGSYLLLALTYISTTVPRSAIRSIRCWRTTPSATTDTAGVLGSNWLC